MERNFEDVIKPYNEEIFSDDYKDLIKPEPSEWECHMFGMDYAIILTPKKGNHPNWFWRWMQYLCFGNRWVKNEDR